MGLTVERKVPPGPGEGLAATDPGQDSETQGQRVRNVFAYVIMQALKDATYGASESHAGHWKLRHAKCGPSRAARHEKRKAWAWLTAGSDDFREVCDLAGVDPDQAKQNIRRVLDRFAPGIRIFEDKPTRALAGVA